MKFFLQMLLVFFVLFSFTVYAQLNVAASVSHMIDDNIDNNMYQLQDHLTTLSLDAGFGWGNDQLTTITYSGIYEHYALHKERNAIIHQLSALYEPNISEQFALSLEAGVSKRIDNESYNIYDHTLFYLQPIAEYDLSENTEIGVSYLFNRVVFNNLPNFDYYEHSLQLQSSVYLPTRTTIISKAFMNFKEYDPYTYTSTDTVTISHPGQGQGSTTRVIRTSEHDVPSAQTSQLAIVVRIAQGITQKTGIAATLQYQWTLQKESRFFLSNYGTIPDDQLFDNPYGYKGYFWGLMVTQVLPLSVKLRFSFYQQQRIYNSLPAFDLGENIIAAHREDTRNTLSISAEKEFRYFSISAIFDTITNSSNDPFYTYNNQAFTLAFFFSL